MNKKTRGKHVMGLSQGPDCRGRYLDVLLFLRELEKKLQAALSGVLRKGSDDLQSSAAPLALPVERDQLARGIGVGHRAQQRNHVGAFGIVHRVVVGAKRFDGVQGVGWLGVGLACRLGHPWTDRRSG